MCGKRPWFLRNTGQHKRLLRRVLTNFDPCHGAVATEGIAATEPFGWRLSFRPLVCLNGDVRACLFSFDIGK